MRYLEPDEILGRCDPSIRQMYEYWDRKRGDRRMPRRRDIDPTELGPFLPSMMIVDVVPDERRYVYRLVGTREVAARGRDPTGQPVGTHFFGSSRNAVMLNYDLVCERRAVHMEDDKFITPEGRFGDEEVLFMPLSEDGQTVSQILVYTHFRDLRAETEKLFLGSQ